VVETAPKITVRVVDGTVTATGGKKELKLDQSGRQRWHGESHGRAHHDDHEPGRRRRDGLTTLKPVIWIKTAEDTRREAL
jgi:hypothetical protein